MSMLCIYSKGISQRIEVACLENYQVYIKIVNHSKIQGDLIFETFHTSNIERKTSGPTTFLSINIKHYRREVKTKIFSNGNHKTVHIFIRYFRRNPRLRVSK